MIKIKIGNAIDIVLTSCIFFVLFFAWIRFYSKNVYLSIFSSIFITFLLVFFLFFYKRKKDTKKELTLKQKNLALDTALQLRFSSAKSVRSYFKKLLENKFKTEEKKDGLLITKNNKLNFFVPCFSEEIFKSDDLARLYSKAKEYNADEITISAVTFDDNCKNLSKAITNIKITLLDAFETYTQLIEPSNELPEKVVNTQKAKLTFRQLLSYALSKERTKSYFMLGIVLIISSFFVLFKIYYLIFGSILMLMAVLTRVLPHKQKNAISSIHL